MIDESEKNETHTAGRREKPAAPPLKALTKALISFLSSIKLAVMLLIILAAVSIIGTVLAQGESSQDNIRFFTNAIWAFYNKFDLVDASSPESVSTYQQLAREYGLKLHNFSHGIGLDRIYNIWYFNLLLGLLSLNLVVCSLKHWPHTWRFFKNPRKILEGEGASGIPLRKEMPLTGKAGDLREASVLSQNALRSAGYKSSVMETDGSYHLFAQKGIWGRLGVFITHLSVLVIFIGAIIGLRSGWKGFVTIEEGAFIDAVSLRGGGANKTLPFAVRCDDFELSYYEGTMRPKDYKSTLTIIEGGVEVMTRVIEVNSPLIHQGIYFYQSSYGETGKAGKVKIRVASSDGSKKHEYTIPLASSGMVLPEFGMKLEILRFIPDFAMEGKRIYTKSNQVVNPAAAVRLTLADGAVQTTWLFQKYPDVHSLQGLAFTVSLLGYEGLQYTGLSVAYDPGVWVIWLGCGLMVIGIFMAFFVTHRRVWVKITPGVKTGVAWIAGSANKNKAGFEEEFHKIAEVLKESLAS